MISVAVLYPNKAGSKFDLDYYVHRHLPLVRDRLKPMGMRSLTYTVERAMDPAAPPQPYRLSAELRFDDMDSASRALQAYGAETQGRHPQLHRRYAGHPDRRGPSGLILCEGLQVPGAATGRAPGMDLYNASVLETIQESV